MLPDYNVEKDWIATPIFCHIVSAFVFFFQPPLENTPNEIQMASQPTHPLTKPRAILTNGSLNKAVTQALVNVWDTLEEG